MELPHPRKQMSERRPLQPAWNWDRRGIFKKITASKGTNKDRGATLLPTCSSPIGGGEVIGNNSADEEEEEEVAAAAAEFNRVVRFRRG